MTDPATYINGRTVQEQMNSLIGYVDTRSAEVALDAIAADVAQVAADKADAHADALAAAASAAAAAGTLANAVKKTGESSQSIAGDVTVAGVLTGGTITAPTPTNNTDAATKKYVDDADALKISITDINNYAVGLTGDQDLTGKKTNVFTAATSGASNAPAGYIEKVSNVTVNSTTSNRYFMLAEAVDSNGVLIAGLNIRYNANGNVHFGLVTTDANGDITQKDIGVFNRSAGTWS